MLLSHSDGERMAIDVGRHLQDLARMACLHSAEDDALPARVPARLLCFVDLRGHQRIKDYRGVETLVACACCGRSGIMQEEALYAYMSKGIFQQVLRACEHRCYSSSEDQGTKWTPAGINHCCSQAVMSCTVIS